MKRNLSNVTKDHVEYLKKWLKKGDLSLCPFNDNNIDCQDDVCSQIFPSLRDPGLHCPCNRFKTKYVVETARKIIKELSCQQST